MRRHMAGDLARLIIIVALLCGFPAHAAPTLKARVVIDATRPVATFRSSEAFGMAADGGAPEEMQSLFLPANNIALRQLSSFPLSYRLRTELGIEAWHWSSEGTWSDPARRQGYWTGRAPKRPESISYGYRLPRRGNTEDEANNDGYSRIDDGDPATFWKSNPYLAGTFTGGSEDHQDWVVVELARPSAVNAIRIRWALPFATRFRVQYWVGADEYDGHWRGFPAGMETNGRGGTQTMRLSRVPVRAQFVRILLERSSHQAAPGSTDRRDRLGYAVSEVELGFTDRQGRLHDLVRHAPTRSGQTVIHVSSTDPWHRSTDIDRGTVQPSLVEMKRRGLLGSGGLMAPVGVLYDTPENMLALLHYLKAAGLPPTRVELGEEPDGQLVSAEDYAALYVEFGRLIRQSFPNVRLGGPSLVNGVSDTWLVDSEDESWTSHFIKFLSAHRAAGLLDFFSFEYFPFDDVCGRASVKLRAQGTQMAALFERLRQDGVPKTIPWLISEYGYSAFGGSALVQMPSALLEADVLGGFLTRGGRGAYLYGVGPNWPIAGRKRCAGRGNLMLWDADREGRARWPMPQFYAYRLITRVWAEPGDRPNRLFAARTNLTDAHGQPLLTAYPLQRPDGRWVTMLVNRSPLPVAASLTPHRKSGERVVWQYSDRQFLWQKVTASGHPSRDEAPPHYSLPIGQPVLLPGLSLTIVEERLSRPRAGKLAAPALANGNGATLTKTAS